MEKYALTLYLVFQSLASFLAIGQQDYLDYHARVIECEQLIADKNLAAAIKQYDSLFSQFDFLFLRDIQVATELSICEKDYESSQRFLRLGIKAGWTLKDINKNDNLRPLRESSGWAKIIFSYDSLHQVYRSRLSLQVREQIHKMFKKDQQKALGALLRVGQRAQDRYAEKKFAPHSEKQLAQLITILLQPGYPGERLIGNSLWGSVILSHHNSISFNYNAKDTIYAELRPHLMNALHSGEISPYELAQIEDWRTATLSGHELTSFGFIGKIPSPAILKTINRNRTEIGLRSIELRNDLIDLERSTGMNLYIPKGWQKRRIMVIDPPK